MLRLMSKTLLGLVFLLSNVHSFQLPDDVLDKLPEGTSTKELEEASQKALEGFMASMFDRGHAEGRLLQGPQILDETAYYPCNSIIQNFTVPDIIEMAKILIQRQPEVQDVPMMDAILMVLDKALFSLMKYDLQVWKVCGRCSDFEPAVGVACEEHEYGYDALQSGVLIAPFNREEGRMYESTLPVNVISTAGGAVPSLVWTYPILQHPIAYLGLLVSAASKTYTLIPDNIGTGESSDHYRAFLNKQSLVTGIAAVLWQAESVVSQETNCASALGDAFVVTGYSEGGYGAVAVADTLSKMGKTIIALHPGGGTYRLSSATIMPALKKVISGDKHMTFYMTLLGAGLSSTTTDAINFGKGQDFIDKNWRDLLVNEVQRTGRRQHPLKMLIPDDEPMSVFNQDIVAVYEKGMANGEAEPCVTSVTNETAALCQALRDQDVVDILESATYPVYLCHSQNDNIIAFANVPDVNANPTYLNLKVVSGLHEPAGGPCIASYLMYYLDDNNVKNFPVADKTCEGGCGCQLPPPEATPKNDSPVNQDCNVLLTFLGICHVGEWYSGLGFFNIDFTF